MAQDIKKWATPLLWNSLSTPSKRTEQELYSLLKELLDRNIDHKEPVKFFKSNIVHLTSILSGSTGKHDPRVYCATLALLHYACVDVNNHVYFLDKSRINPILDVIDYYQHELTGSAFAEMRLQLLETAVSILLQLSSGNDANHQALLDHGIVLKLLNLLNPAKSKVYNWPKEADGAKILDEVIKGKSLVGHLNENLSDEEIHSSCTAFFKQNGVKAVIPHLHKPKVSYTVSLFDTSGPIDLDIGGELAKKGVIFTKPLNVEFATDRWQDIVPVCAINVSTFWAQMSTEIPKKISDILEKWPNKQYLQRIPNPGSFVGCKNNDTYCRCQVLSCNAETVKVFLLDFGSVMDIPSHNLFLLVQEMNMKLYKPQATLLRIDGISPPPVSCGLVEHALTTLSNLATVFKNIDYLCNQDPYENLCPLLQCGNTRIMMRTFRVLSNMARSDMTKLQLADTDIFTIILNLCATYDSVVHQADPSISDMLVAALRTLTNLLYSCQQNRETFESLNGISVIVNLVKSSTPRVTSEAYKALKNYLGHVPITPLTDRNLKDLTPRSKDEEEKLEQALAELRTPPVPLRSRSRGRSRSEREGRSLDREESSKPRSRSRSITECPLAMEECGAYSSSEKKTKKPIPASFEYTPEGITTFEKGHSTGMVPDETHCFVNFGSRDIKRLRSDVPVKSACAFLNSAKGGSIFLGVGNNGIAEGIIATRDQKDELRMGMDKNFSSQIRGPVVASDFEIKFHPVRKYSQILENCYIVEIIIKKNVSGMLYATTTSNVYFREGSEIIEATPDLVHKKFLLQREEKYFPEVDGLCKDLQRLKREIERQKKHKKSGK